MDKRKPDYILLLAVVLGSGCVCIDHRNLGMCSLCVAGRRTPAKAERYTDVESSSVKAAKQTLLRFMATPHWRDRKPDGEINNAVDILSGAGEAGIDLLEQLSTSNNAFLPSDAMRAIVRSGSTRGPSIIARYLATTQSGLARRMVVWQIMEIGHISRKLKNAYSEVILAEIWRSRKPRDLAEETYLLDLVRTLEVLDGRKYWENRGGGGVLSEFSSEDLKRAVRRCLASHLLAT